MSIKKFFFKKYSTYLHLHSITARPNPYLQSSWRVNNVNGSIAVQGHHVNFMHVWVCCQTHSEFSISTSYLMFFTCLYEKSNPAELWALVMIPNWKDESFYFWPGHSWDDERPSPMVRGHAQTCSLASGQRGAPQLRFTNKGWLALASLCKETTRSEDAPSQCDALG